MIDLFKSLALNFDTPHHHVYSTDKNHIFLGCNESQATDVGLSTSQDAVGKASYDFYPSKESEVFISHNEEVLKTGVAQFFEEFTLLSNNTIVTYFSYKLPLKDRKNKTIGVMGITVPVETIASTVKITLSHPELSRLSPQQLSCFNLLVKGLTVKQIAQKMKLSPRTIEHYVANIRMKLECKNLRELVVRYANKIQ